MLFISADGSEVLDVNFVPHGPIVVDHFGKAGLADRCAQYPTRPRKLH
jgi:hypothetical protein